MQKPNLNLPELDFSRRLMVVSNEKNRSQLEYSAPRTTGGLHLTVGPRLSLKTRGLQTRHISTGATNMGMTSFTSATTRTSFNLRETPKIMR